MNTFFLETYISLLAIHSFSGYLSFIPFAIRFNFSVNLGPISYNLHLVPSSWNTYLWCLKKIKSLIFKNETTVLALNIGF